LVIDEILFKLISTLIIGPEYLQHMWSYICPELLQAIESEPESDVAAEMYEALGKVNIKNDIFIVFQFLKFCLKLFSV